LAGRSPYLSAAGEGDGPLFTGIVTDLGRVRAIERRGDSRFAIATSYDLAGVSLGASIACSGACLTVVDKGLGEAGGWFAADVSAETLSKTTLGSWQVGSTVNLERPLALGAELGGHLVTGHVDGTAAVVLREREGDSWRFRFRAPADLKHYIAAKGSVALDGVSLTVNEVLDDVFGVNVIPHTASVTTFGERRVGDRVNLEIDLLARYLARLIGKA
jgi:riboflavin synthase